MNWPTERFLVVDMEFGEAHSRFIGNSPKELADNVAAEKEKRGPPKQSPPVKMDDKPPKRPAKPLN
ncbi:hypothetical protein [Sphingomonas sp. PWP1-2]|uniref:hypothetical protein n=1 Tax=Sphingomonas sp. PWP1-2 TaxID=2804558 RepID=UPI003CEFD258